MWNLVAADSQRLDIRPGNCAPRVPWQHAALLAILLVVAKARAYVSAADGLDAAERGEDAEPLFRHALGSGDDRLEALVWSNLGTLYWDRAKRALARATIAGDVHRAKMLLSDARGAFKRSLSFWTDATVEGNLERLGRFQHNLQIWRSPLRRALRIWWRLPGGNVTVWTWASAGFVDMADNLRQSVLQNAPHLHFCTACLDRATLAKVKGCKALTPTQEVYTFRWRLLLSALRSSRWVLLLDSDTVILRDPLPWLTDSFAASTDHIFWPVDLWSTRWRPEEHVNTGVLWVRRSRANALLLRTFLRQDASPLTPQGFDDFDQRRFTQFLLRNGWQDQVHVLDPWIFAHGLNFFWRGVASHAQPAIVHANFGRAKIFHFREAGLWWPDQQPGALERRFQGRDFLVLRLPGNATFAIAMRALSVALMVAGERWLVLPDTLNCKLCPAHPLMPRRRFCRYDHFLSAKDLVENYRVVESSITRQPWFTNLPAERKQMFDFDFVDLTPKPSVGVPCQWIGFPQRYLPAPVGNASMPPPSSCGVKGLDCCRAFWGWADKLSYFTDGVVRWTLDCGCDLGLSFGPCRSTGDLCLPEQHPLVQGNEGTYK